MYVYAYIHAHTHAYTYIHVQANTLTHIPIHNLLVLVSASLVNPD